MSNGPRRWVEYRHLVTFGDTNSAGSIYFARYFSWMGESRERLLAEFYPEFADDLKQGFCLVTESAQMDFFHEGALFDEVVFRLTVISLTRSRIEFEIEFLKAADATKLARGKQAVIWTNAQHRPALMPDKLFDATASYFGITPA